MSHSIAEKMDVAAIQCCVLTPRESVYSLLGAGSEGVVRPSVPLFWVATGSALLDLGLHNNIQRHAGLAHLQRMRRGAGKCVDVVLRGRWVGASGLRLWPVPRRTVNFMLVFGKLPLPFSAYRSKCNLAWWNAKARVISLRLDDKLGLQAALMRF